MRGAAFLLIVNFAIGLSFAVAFIAAARRSESRLGYWCAGGFLAAASTVAIESFAPYIPWPQLTSFLSFSLFLLALTLIASGLQRHFNRDGRIRTIWILYALSIASHPLIIYHLPRDSSAHAFSYQGSSVLIAAIGSAIILRNKVLRPIDRAVGTVLALCSLQFLAKAALATAITTGQSVQTYVVSTYAQFSQTTGAILSLLLGLSLLGLVIVEVMSRAAAEAQIDGLSGVLLRKAFLKQGRDIITEATASLPCCFIMADLDHFKSVNDRFGHAAGDEVLRHFGQILNNLTAGKGACGRLGGEEFAIVLPQTDEGKARLFIHAVMSSLAEHPFDLVPKNARITSSFGAVVCGHAAELDVIMRCADQALYDAKRGGRDGYRFATGNPDLIATPAILVSG